MTENYKSFLTKSIWFTIGMFCLRCLFSQTKIITEFTLYDIYGYAGEAIAFSAIVILLYERWLWRINPFEKVPRLKRRYIGTLYTTYNDKQIEKSLELEIHQTLLSVKVVLVTDESKSKSISASIDKIQDEWQLVYCYINVPRANVRERSEIHYGTAMICIEDPKEMRGDYYTDRKTQGEMKFGLEKKERNRIVKFLLSPVLHNIAGGITLIFLIALAVLINMISLAGIWRKILASCYIVVVIGFLLILGMPKSEKKVGFTKNTIVSFIMWCVIIPIITGIVFMLIISKFLPTIAIEDIGLWSLSMCIIVFSFAWFLSKLYGEMDVTLHLDFYSTAWVAMVTVVTTVLELEEKIGAFGLLLAMYLILQLLIKDRMRRIQEKNSEN